MGAKQLAIVLAPNILYEDAINMDPSTIVVALATCNQVVFKLISYFERHEDQLGENTVTPRTWRKSKERKPPGNEKLLQQIRNHGGNKNDDRVPLSSLKPPSKPKINSSPTKPKPVLLDASGVHEQLNASSGDRATTEFKIVTEEEVVVKIEEPSEVLTVEQLAMKRKASLANINRPDIKERNTSPLAQEAKSPKVERKNEPEESQNESEESKNEPEEPDGSTEPNQNQVSNTNSAPQLTYSGRWIPGILRKDDDE